MDQKLLEILVCPVCKGPLVYQEDEPRLICRADRVAYLIKDGIPAMLADEAVKLTDDELSE